MVWQDVMFDEIPNRKDLIHALSVSLVVPEEDILVVSDITEMENHLPTNVRVVCETGLCRSAFTLKTTIYIYDDSLIPTNTLQTIGVMSESLRCRAIVGSDSVIPNDWVLIKGVNDYASIVVSADEFDDTVSYELK